MPPSLVAESHKKMHIPLQVTLFGVDIFYTICYLIYCEMQVLIYGMNFVRELFVIFYYILYKITCSGMCIFLCDSATCSLNRIFFVD